MLSLNTKFCNIKNVNLHLCNILNALDVLSLNSQSYEEGRILPEDINWGMELWQELFWITWINDRNEFRLIFLVCTRAISTTGHATSWCFEDSKLINILS